MSAPNVQLWLDPDGPSPVWLRDLGDYELSRVRGDIGSVSLDYPVDGQDFSRLERVLEAGVEVEVAVRTDGTSATERRALLLAGKGDRSKVGGSYNFTGLWIAHILRAAVLYYRQDVENGETQLSGTPGLMMVTLMQRAQAAGLLPGITWDFSATKDSNGQNWAKTALVSWSPGRDYVSILQELEDELGLAEWDLTNGRVLRLFNPGTRGRDRTLPPASSQVVLERGRDLVDAPATGSNVNAGTRVVAFGKDGLYASATNAAAEARRGRPIVIYRSFNNVTDQGTLDALAQAEAELVATGEHEYSHELTLGAGCPMPGVDFDVSDWVLRRINGATERLQVAQTVLRRQSGVVTSTVTLGDLIDAHEVKTRRIIQRLANGSAVVGTSAPAPEVDDGKAPAVPVGLTASSVPYKQGAATVVSVQLGWEQVTTNADGSPATDITGYGVQWRTTPTDVDIPWVPAGTPDEPYLSFGGLPPGVSVDLRVAAHDKFGHVSGWSATLTITTERDNTPPQKPSALLATVELGQVLLEFDERGADGAPMPADYSEWELHRDLGAAFETTQDTLVNVHARGTKRSVWTTRSAEDYGVTQYFRVVAIDRDGNRSVPSDVVAAIPTALGFADFAYKDNGNLAEDGSFEDPSGRVINAERSNAAWSFVQGSSSDLADHGTWYARATASVGSGSRPLVLSPRLPVTSGQQYFQRLAVRRNAAANGAVSMQVLFFLRDGQVTTSELAMPAAEFVAGAWTARQTAYHVAPANSYEMQVRVSITGAATTGLWDVDRVEVREALGTALIQDAAITNAKIVNLSVAKLMSGELSAVIALLGEIRTANAPNARVVINDTGIRKYDSNNVLRFEVTETETMIDGKLVTGAPGQSRIEIGNATEGRDNLKAFDTGSSDPVAIIGQVYNIATSSPDRSGLLIQDTSQAGADVFWAYGGGSSAYRRTIGGRAQTITFDCTLPGEGAAGDGGFLQLNRAVNGDTYIGRRLPNSRNSFIWWNSSGTEIHQVAQTVIAEINTNGLIASRLRGYGGAAILEAVNGGDVYFTYNSQGTPFINAGGANYQVKSFVVDHPDDPDRLLVHGCTESPYAGLEYWGEVDVVDHHAVVELPSYFEGIARENGRQVQVSVVLPDEPEPTEAPPTRVVGPTAAAMPWPPPPELPVQEVVPAVAASRPRDGRFRVSCSVPNARVAWLVKAIRADVPELVPEPLRSEVDVRGSGPYTWTTPRAA